MATETRDQMCVFRKVPNLIHIPFFENCSTWPSYPRKPVQVWAHNLEEEFEKMIKVLEQGQCQYIAMDTEFPGIVINNPGCPGDGQRSRPLDSNGKAVT